MKCHFKKCPRRTSTICFFLKKWASFSFILHLFQTKNAIFTANQCEKCPNVRPVYGAGIQTHELSNLSHYPLPLVQGSHPVPSAVTLTLTHTYQGYSVVNLRNALELYSTQISNHYNLRIALRS